MFCPLQTIQKYNMLSSGDFVVIGLSGGADSVALLHVLTTLREKHALSLLAVHVHHGLRGLEADQDASFAQELCGRLQVACKIVSLDVSAERQKLGLGEEEAGRKLRYQVFQTEAGATGKIAVAHNEKDQAETVIMRLCRGAGPLGLSGIPPVRGNIIRPLLYSSREEIERYCRHNQLSFRQDSTNFEPNYTRNKVRLQVLPLLEHCCNVKAIQHAAQSAKLCWEERQWIEKELNQHWESCVVEQTDQKIVLDVQHLRSLDCFLQKELLRKSFRFLQKDGKDLSMLHIDGLLNLIKKTTGKKNSLPFGIEAKVQYGLLCLSAEDAKGLPFCYDLPVGQAVYVKEKKYFVCLSEQKMASNVRFLYTKVFHYDTIKGNLQFRSRRSGDVIALFGLRGKKKIKDFFIDEKIPAEKRNEIPLLASGSDIICIVGHRDSCEFFADGKTNHHLWLQIWEDV